ncbi:tetracycline resistance transcriptional repressor TetR [Massilia sp. MB5]|uniref:tetracycline resistance transcriptional repressor TetR n=1 Tax=Massilia sp. MB5 TaxID=2919578 RepID=UPI001F0ED882|nr:tetracycline resistance transcriptional repressor TetR [Massilia sp. MB5]UMR33143.1 tetracycline resistance transcriptional repressor TetR [Massilia sp. MB5]
MKVERKQIVAAALDLLNEVGVDKLSTRLLAERLGVQQPALYWHFKNKRALLDAMNLEIMERAHQRTLPQAGEDWRSFLGENAHSFRRALLDYRDGARLHAGSEPVPDTLPALDAQLRFLCETGMEMGAAIDLLVTISHYVVGCVLEEQADHPDPTTLDESVLAYPQLAAAMQRYRQRSPDQHFEAGLALILNGAA